MTKNRKLTAPASQAQVNLTTVDGIFAALEAGKISREAAQQAHAKLSRVVDNSQVCKVEVQEPNGQYGATVKVTIKGTAKPVVKSPAAWRIIAENMAEILDCCEQAAAMPKAAKSS